MSDVSPRPWKLGRCDCDSKRVTIRDAADEAVIPDISGVYESEPNDVKLADMAHIVKCVNCHDVLVSALELMLEKFRYDCAPGEAGWDAIAAARQAVINAKGR